MLKNIFIIFNLIFLMASWATDPLFEQQVECPVEETRPSGFSFMEAFRAAPCQLFPLGTIVPGPGSEPAPIEVRCREFSRSMDKNCQDRDDSRSVSGYTDCLVNFYHGTRNGQEVSYPPAEIERSHADRTRQLNETYMGMITTQAELARSQNLNALMQLTIAVRDRASGGSRASSGTLANFSCLSYTDEDYRNNLITCENEESTFRLHRLLDQVEASRSNGRLEQRVRDILQVTIEDIDGGVREGLDYSSISTQAMVQDLSMLQVDAIGRQFYDYREEAENGDVNFFTDKLNFRKDYGDNIQAMRLDVTNIMNRQYERLAQQYQPGYKGDMFAESNFPTREEFERRRDQFINKLEKRYRLFMTMSNVLESAIIPRQTATSTHGSASADALRAQIQREVDMHGITSQELANTGWFTVDENNEVDFDPEFYSFLQTRLQQMAQEGNLQQMGSISDMAELWFQYQQAQLMDLATNCERFQESVGSLCESIERNEIVMTSSAARSCLENTEQRFTISNRIEFAHQACAGGENFYPDGEPRLTPNRYYSGAGNPRGSGTTDGLPGYDPEYQPDGVNRPSGEIPTPGGEGRSNTPETPQLLGQFLRDATRDRADRIISAQEGQNRATLVTTGALTDFVDANNTIETERNMETQGNNTGLFGNLFDDNGQENDPLGGQSMWDYLTRQNDDTTTVDEETREVDSENVGEELVEESTPEDAVSESIRNRIAQLEEELARARSENESPSSNEVDDPRIARLQEEIRIQQQELNRMRELQEENARAAQAQARRNQGGAPLNASPRNPVNTTRSPASRGNGNNVLGENENGNSFNANAPVVNNGIGNIQTNTNRINRSVGGEESVENSGINLASGSFASSGANSLGIKLSVREVAEINEIPANRIVTAIQPGVLDGLQPGEAIYLQIEEGIYIKHQRNSEGSIITQRVRLKNEYDYLPTDGKVRPFERQKVSMGRVIIRLEAIEEEAGIK
jgi:hypothetical protein